ncbi:MAG TPA: PfkB family carbohydrate kinase [Streptosporangiaceae bacterium]
MIVTVTLNAALGVVYETPRLTPGAVNEVTGVRYLAAGRGIGVAKVLHTFGHEVIAAGLAGGAAGEMIRADLSRAAIPADFTSIGRESRRVVEIRDEAGGLRTRLGEPGPYITTEELGRFAADYRRLLAGATAVVLCGSLPAGLPTEIYGTLASYAAEAGVPAIIDAAGPALRYGAARRPALVVLEAADGLDPARLVADGAGAAALLADHAIRAVTADGQWRAWLPRAAQSGWSREALVAGLVPGVLLAWSWQDRLRHAVALGAASNGGGVVDLTAYERLMASVRAEPPDRGPAEPPGGLPG